MLPFYISYENFLLIPLNKTMRGLIKTDSSRKFQKLEVESTPAVVRRKVVDEVFDQDPVLCRRQYMKKFTDRVRNGEDNSYIVKFHENFRRNSNEETHRVTVFGSVRNLFPGSKNTGIQPSTWSKRHLNADFEKLDGRDLNEDTFSILLVCEYKTYAMVFACSVIMFQFGILFCFLLESFPTNFSSSPIPVGVRTDVRIAQALTIPLMVATQDDLTHGVCCIYDGYTKKMKKIAPHATRVRFITVYCLQSLVGILYLVAIFSLVILNDRIVNMFLNFAALSFVSLIDDAFFNFASNFLITDELGVLTRQIRNVRIPIPKKSPSQIGSVSSYRFINFLHLLSLIYIGWIFIVVKQLEGTFSCQSLLAQFGDEAIPEFGYYSGAYDRIKYVGSPGYQINERFVYVHRDQGKVKTLFAYCDTLEAWTLNSFETDYISDIDPCKSYLLKSQRVPGYDIREAAVTKWVTSDGSTIDYFSLRCNTCDGCNNNGQCIDDKCFCDAGSFGVNCEFSDETLCDKLHPTYENGTDTSAFSVITQSSITHYSDRPIFYREDVPILPNHTIFDRGGTPKAQRFFEVVLFSGRRWMYYHSSFMKEVKEETAINSIEQFIPKVISSQVYPTYLSEPVAYRSHLDTGVPSRVSWKSNFLSKKYDKESAAFLGLICRTCDSKRNPCLHEGVCEAGQCKCPKFFKGYICENFVGIN